LVRHKFIKNDKKPHFIFDVKIGGGEQNLMRLLPAVILSSYMESTGKLKHFFNESNC